MLREYCRVGSTISTSAGTVTDVLQKIMSRPPEVYQSICKETGTIRPHINPFLNSDIITKKGLFIAESDGTRERFELRGPFGPGVAVYSVRTDDRDSTHIFASSCHSFLETKVLVSTGGKPFSKTAAPAFPENDGRVMESIGSLAPGDDKDELWCGVQPAARFQRTDAGASWQMTHGISHHEHAEHWQPDNGGLCLHTIVVHSDNPDVAYVMPPDSTPRTRPDAAPALWRSENGGEAWDRIDRGLSKQDAYFTVSRDAMTMDRGRNPAV